MGNQSMKHNMIIHSDYTTKHKILKEKIGWEKKALKIWDVCLPSWIMVHFWVIQVISDQHENKNERGTAVASRRGDFFSEYKLPIKA